MKTYIVTVRQPKKTAGKYFTTRGVVVAESEEQALHDVQHCFPAGARGWAEGSEFEILELPPHLFKMI